MCVGCHVYGSLCKCVCVCVRFVNRKCEDACSEGTQRNGISHSDRTALLNEAHNVCVAFNAGGLLCGVCKFWTAD